MIQLARTAKQNILQNPTLLRMPSWGHGTHTSICPTLGSFWEVRAAADCIMGTGGAVGQWFCCSRGSWSTDRCSVPKAL